jgi:hypothetical protein
MGVFIDLQDGDFSLHNKKDNSDCGFVASKANTDIGCAWI